MEHGSDSLSQRRPEVLLLCLCFPWPPDEHQIVQFILAFKGTATCRHLSPLGLLVKLLCSFCALVPLHALAHHCRFLSKASISDGVWDSMLAPNQLGWDSRYTWYCYSCCLHFHSMCQVEIFAVSFSPRLGKWSTVFWSTTSVQMPQRAPVTSTNIYTIYTTSRLSGCIMSYIQLLRAKDANRKVASMRIKARSGTCSTGGAPGTGTFLSLTVAALSRSDTVFGEEKIVAQILTNCMVVECSNTIKSLIGIMDA